MHVSPGISPILLNIFCLHVQRHDTVRNGTCTSKTHHPEIVKLAGGTDYYSLKLLALIF